MSYWVHYNIEGHRIGFMDSHIVFSPELNLDDPSVIQALKTATEVSHIVHAICAASDSYPLNQLEMVPDETLKELIEYREIARNQNRVPVEQYVLDYYAACEAELYRRETKSPAANRNGKKNGRVRHPGYVYLLRSDKGFYKIGKTKNPQNRLETFHVKLPFEVEFEHLIQSDDMNKLEMDLHTRFNDKRVNGEWFDLAAADVAYIKSLDGLQ